MDITFRTEAGRFNFRVCAIMLHDDRILAMRDERSPYYYLPGGRVSLHETAEQAILRELQEELGIDARVVRPLWVNEHFFVEEVDQERYHEMCVYFLMDVSETALLSRGETFVLNEGKHTHAFEWLTFEQLKSTYFYPLFLKERIFHLPDALEWLTTSESP